MALSYQKMKIEDIGEWCKANGQVEWLKETAKTLIDKPIYPKIKNAKGKMVEDKTQEPIGTTKVRIDFINLKKAFALKFMPEIMPKAAKKQSMYDYIDSL